MAIVISQNLNGNFNVEFDFRVLNNGSEAFKVLTDLTAEEIGQLIFGN